MADQPLQKVPNRLQGKLQHLRHMASWLALCQLPLIYIFPSSRSPIIIGIKTCFIIYDLVSQIFELQHTQLQQNNKGARLGALFDCRVTILVAVHPCLVTAVGIYTLLNVSTPHYSIRDDHLYAPGGIILRDFVGIGNIRSWEESFLLELLSPEK